jgi:hypothetical protein
MKKIISVLILSSFISQAFAAGSFLAALHDKRIALGGISTTTTTSSAYGLLAGIIAFADNGEAYVNLGSEQAQDALKLAVQKVLDGETLNNEDKAILEIYATQTNNDVSKLIEKVSSEL